MRRLLPLTAALAAGIALPGFAQTVTVTPLSDAPVSGTLNPAPSASSASREETVIQPDGTTTTRTTTTTTTTAPPPLPPSVRVSNTAAPQTPALDPSISAMTAGDLIGREVYDTDGEEIGEIAGVAWNNVSQTGSAIVELDTGVLGIGDRQVTVDLIQLRRHEDRLYLSSLTKEQLKGKPEFDENSEWRRYDRKDTVGAPPH